ncbi:MAG: hypothetical protein NTV49_01680 [Kiritimatiellaeota bacterium]|nr:hypothetical protein [Kiritimatiellota bacterium]
MKTPAARPAVKVGLSQAGAVATALLLATLVWLPLLHLLFRPQLDQFYAERGLPSKARAIAAHQLALCSNTAARAGEIATMRRSNAEWDFMGRTYLVLALANMGLRQPEDKKAYLLIMDQLIEETIRLEQSHGVYYFLMDYAKAGIFRAQPQRSLFQDGEIAVMLAARRLLEEKPSYQPLLTRRVATLVAQMRQSPVLCGESYPDECWMFCNVLALDALRMADALDGTDHAPLLRDWVALARRKLVDPTTGLLVASFTFEGQPTQGPEGSSIWMVAHGLQIVDPAFAADQYQRSKRDLARRVLGFGYAREWPVSWRGQPDVDSGPVIPLLDISAGSSGLALVGASAFRDRDYLSALLTSLTYGGFPILRHGQLRYAAGNQVGDAVLLYAMVLGPLWAEVEKRGARQP